MVNYSFSIYIPTDNIFETYKSQISATTAIEITILVIASFSWIAFEFVSEGLFKSIYRVKSIMIIINISLEIVNGTGLLAVHVMGNILIEIGKFTVLYTQSCSVFFLHMVYKCTCSAKIVEQTFHALLLRMITSFLSLMAVKAIRYGLLNIDIVGMVGEIFMQINPLELVANCVLIFLSMYFGISSLIVIFKNFFRAQNRSRVTRIALIYSFLTVIGVLFNQLAVLGLKITQNVFFGLHTHALVECMQQGLGQEGQEEFLKCEAVMIKEMKRQGLSFIKPAWSQAMEVITVAVLNVVKRMMK